MDSREVYLGDGLYASFDGFMFILRAPRTGGDHWVGLEPAVMRAFDNYRREQLDALRAKRSDQEHTNAASDQEATSK